MDLEVQGQLVEILDKVTGEGRNGTWEKQEFVIETQGQYPKKICFSLWGERTSYLEKLSQGDGIKVKFNVESREYKGKWYTDARAWRIEGVEAQDDVPPSMNPDELPDDFNVNNDTPDNLPF